MAEYRNVMETIVEEKYEQIVDTLDCCHCNHCRADIVAYALNHLPTKYVVTNKGELFAKYATLGEQYRIDILSALAKAASIVKEHPNHQ